MRYFRWIAIGMVIAGMLGAVLALVFAIEPFWILGSVMLAISGAVKIVMLYLWRELTPPNQTSLPAPRDR